MVVRIFASLVGGLGPRDFAVRTHRTLSGAVRAGVQAATNGLKAQLRDEVIGVGLGGPLANAIGSRMFPDKTKETLHPTGMVYPRGKKAAAIFDALNAGVPIHARNGKYLAVPTRNAFFGGRGGHRLTPREFEQRSGVKLFVVKSKRPGTLLLMGRRRSGSVANLPGKRVRRSRKPKAGSVVYFILVPMVRPGPRLSFDAMARRWADLIPGLIERATPVTVQ